MPVILPTTAALHHKLSVLSYLVLCAGASKRQLSHILDELGVERWCLSWGLTAHPPTTAGHTEPAYPPATIMDPVSQSILLGTLENLQHVSLFRH